MRVYFKLLLAFTLLGLLLAACSSDKAPSLAVADQPTLVFVYTDG